jgi:hypothetical protein
VEDANSIDEARRIAWRFLNRACIFVVPAFFAAHDPTELRAEVLQCIAGYLEAVVSLRDHPIHDKDDKRGLLRLGTYALKLRELLQQWEPERPVPSEIIQTVDACLKAVGVTLSAPEDGSQTPR